MSFSAAVNTSDPSLFPTGTTPLIAPYWASGVDLENGGQVFFRETSNSTLLNCSRNDIWSRFQDQVSAFEPTSLVIVTWYRIAEFNNGSEVRLVNE